MAKTLSDLMMNTNVEDDALTPQQLADKWQVCRNSIAKMEKRGLPVIVLGPRLKRYPWRRCCAWAASHELPA